MKNGVNILLVEDDLLDVKTLRRAFKENKITNPLNVTGNGEEALAFLRHEEPYTESETSPKPGIILLDLNMPVMGGIEFLKIVKSNENFKIIPVVVMTTSKEENDLVESYKLGVAGYILKPMDFYQFVKVIKAIDLYWTLNELPE